MKAGCAWGYRHGPTLGLGLLPAGARGARQGAVVAAPALALGDDDDDLVGPECVADPGFDPFDDPGHWCCDLVFHLHGFDHRDQLPWTHGGSRRHLDAHDRALQRSASRRQTRTVNPSAQQAPGGKRPASGFGLVPGS